MKVLHVINTLAAGGAELHLLTLCRGLRSHGVDLAVAFGRESIGDSRSLRADFEKAGIRTIKAGAERRYDPSFPVKILRVLGAERPDIVHSHLTRADLATAIAGRLIGSPPWIVSVHGLHDDRATWSGRPWMPLVRRLWAGADRIIAISEAVKSWLVREQAIPAARVSVVHYGIDVSRFASATLDVRRAWGFTDEPLVGSIGRLEPRKGHEHLIRAMDSVRRSVPRAALVIAGHDPGGYRTVLERLIASLALQQAVRLVGFQSDIPAFLAGVDVFAFASDSEGFGQVIVEAMAAAKPVVANRMAPLTEIVVDGNSGILVTPGEPEHLAQAVVRLLSNGEEARQMGQRGRTRAKDLFSADTMSSRTVQIYRDVLATRGVA
jgi:glycosyltransferase involved in cell wall biosynthesis